MTACAIDRNAPFDGAMWVTAAEERGYDLVAVHCLTTGARVLRIMNPEGQRAPDDLDLHYWSAGRDDEAHDRNIQAILDHLDEIGQRREVPLYRGTEAEHEAARVRFGAACGQ